MSIRKKELHEMIDRLDQSNEKSAYDFLKFLTEYSYKDYWDEIKNREPDDEPLSEEELEQLKGEKDYTPWEKVKNEFQL